METETYSESSDYTSYSDDFESDAESTERTQSLFEVLAESLENNYQLNTQTHPVAGQFKEKLLLAKLKNSKHHLHQNLSETYLEHKQIYSEPSKFEVQSDKLKLDFSQFLNSLHKKAKIESNYIERCQKLKTQKVISKVRNWVLRTIALLLKERKHAEIMLQNIKEMNNIKSKELLDELYWEKFISIIKAISKRKAVTSFPTAELKQDIKTLLEKTLSCNVFVKNVVAVEDFDFKSALGNRRGFVNFSDRKIEVSKEVSEDSQKAQVLESFLKLSNRTTQSLPNTSLRSNINEEEYLSRICKFYLVIETTRVCEYHPVSNFVYLSLEKRPLLEPEIDTLSEESQIDPQLVPTQVLSFKIRGIKLKITVKNQKFKLRAAKVKHLLQTPEASNQILSSGIKHLYLLDTTTFYTSKSPKYILRSLNSNDNLETEKLELIKAYTLQSPTLQLLPSCFPDKLFPRMNYLYLLVKDQVYLSSTTFTKNYFVQFRPPTTKLASKPLNICKVEYCFAPVVTEPLLLPRKTKKLNPVTRRRSPIERTESLCMTHKLIKVKSKTNLGEFWKACQAGMNWQSEINEASRFGMLLSGTAKLLLKDFFSKVLESPLKLPETSENPEHFKLYRLSLLQKEEELKVTYKQKLKLVEEACTNEVRRIAFVGIPQGFYKSVSASIKQAYQLDPENKFYKLKSIREKLEASFSCRTNYTQDQTTLPCSQVSSRPSSVPKFAYDKLKLSEANRRRNPDVLHKKLYSSPYNDLPPKRPLKKKVNRTTKQFAENFSEANNSVRFFL